MKVYLAGPMRGIPDFNFPAFHSATDDLRARGFEVFSPAENDIKQFGADKFIAGINPNGDDESAAARVGMAELQYRRILFAQDMAFICEHADAVVMLPGWERSKGAKAERATAEALGLPVYLYPNVDSQHAL